MSHLKSKRSGDALVILAAFLWSWFPLLVTQGLKEVPPLLVMGICNSIAAIFLGGIITFQKGWKKFKSRNLLKNLAIISLFMLLAYIVLFSAAPLTTPNQIGILGLSQTFWGILILGGFGLERVNRSGIFGTVIMLLGAFFVMSNEGFTWNRGDIFILIANACFVSGNIFQRRGRKEVPGIYVIFSRSLVIGLFGMLLGTLQNPDFSVIKLSHLQWELLIILGIFIFSIEKLSWLEGIHRIPITRANIIASIHPALTMFWSFFLLGTTPTYFQWIGFILMFCGACFIMNKKETSVILEE